LDDRVKGDMPKLFDKKQKVKSIGNELVNCQNHCDGIQNNPEDGILRRCLIFEGRIGANGAIVVGLNPGKAKKSEQTFLLEHNNTYEAVETYWTQKIKNFQYYKKIEELLAKLGFDGSILWTELVKCQCSEENGIIPIQTMRTCINTYLKREIELFPNYAIFGIGNQAFDFCSLSFPNHFIIGIPHPTGSYGNFSRLMKNIDKNKQKYIEKIADKRDKNDRYMALRIFE